MSKVSPTARMTLSHSKRCTSSVGMGRRRPDLSYSPRRVFTISMAFTLPSRAAQDAVRRGEKDEAHAFFFGGLNLFVDGGHVFALAAIEDGGLAAHAQHGARGIDGRIAAADDGDAGTDRDFFAARHGLKKDQRGIDVFQLGAGQIEPGFLPGSDGDEDGVEVRWRDR